MTNHTGMMTEGEFLEQAGVKGMKWGVRKEDKLVGSSSSKKEESTDKALSKEYAEQAKHIRSELKSRGHTEIDSEALKAKYETPVGEKPGKGLSDKQKLALGIGVGIAAVGALAYLNYKGNSMLKLDATRLSAYSDTANGLKINWDAGVSLPKGSVIKRISTVAENKIRPGGFFGCFLDDDVKSYSAILPSFWQSWGVGSPLTGGFINHYKAGASVAAPSGKETLEIFRSLVDTNPIFRAGLGQGHFIPTNDLPLKHYSGMFEDFSAKWIDNTSLTTNTFFDAVKDKGYNALIDFNDAGKLGKTPLRVIDSSIFSIVKNEPLKLKDMVAAAKDWTPSLVHMLSNLNRNINNQKGNIMTSTVTGMMTEEDFLKHADMTPDEWLEHYGKKGMKWGQKMAEGSMGVLAKSRNVRKDGVAGKQTKEQRDAAIDKARENIDDGTNAKNFTNAQTAMRKAKGTDGHEAAKAAFNAVKDKNVDDYHDSQLAKSGSEKTKVALLATAAVVLSVAISRI